MVNIATTPGHISSASFGHSDPCTQEFTPSPYAMFRPLPPLSPPIYYSYSIDARPYVSPRTGTCSIPLRLCSCIMLLLWAFLILPPQFHRRSGITGSSSRFPLVFKGMLAAISFHCCRFPLVFKGDVSSHYFPLFPLIRPYSYNDNKSMNIIGVVARSGRNVLG